MYAKEQVSVKQNIYANLRHLQQNNLITKYQPAN